MYNGVLWETTHQGKMKGIPSIGTCCATNPICMQRQKDKNSVCAKCYAERYVKMRSTLKQHLTENANILSTRLLEKRELPYINQMIYRFESFGDLHNEIHLKNFIKIAEHNPNTRFALWTKNIWILDNVFIKEMVSKPNNLIVVASSPLLNKALTITRPYIDHTFTVFDGKYIKEHNIQINCTSKSCLLCRKCYEKNGSFDIYEQLK
ncbi:MAG TPA: hypothetical protein DCW90_09405 [Lachnospiraceae bacterium]|nr:hypothetical protein [Lachnospiraceae bacterium]